MVDGTKVIFTTPPVDIFITPDELPAVYVPNVEAALVLLSGALTALDRAGFEMEHTDGPYGEVQRAIVSVIERAFPGIDGNAVVVDRHSYDGEEGRNILGALVEARRNLKA
ncbi:hypothetical protein E1091_03430 [Micromonospora fluostatini]|uniref:Thiamine-binding protein domain-containing protein n=1 Tax=Micromonospora fluostatini TaxID=1629071 RepID=A0ABY2DKF2_9ACTN|nr:hypothetical protein E1091_03430 [Micromonospora fluostatini]